MLARAVREWNKQVQWRYWVSYKSISCSEGSPGNRQTDRMMVCKAILHTLIVTALCPLTVEANAQITRLPDKFTYAESEIENWEMKAITKIRWSYRDIRKRPNYPNIDKIECLGESDDIQFSMSAEGSISWMNLGFHGEPDEDGYRRDLTTIGDRLWLYIDRERWEFARVGVPLATFSNVSYPTSNEEDENVIILTWRGYKAVRKSENEPLVHISRLYEKIISAKTIKWGFKSRDWDDIGSRTPSNELPKGWKRKRYSIKNSNLKSAVDWCSKQVQSRQARSLPPEVLRYIGE